MVTQAVQVRLGLNGTSIRCFLVCSGEEGTEAGRTGEADCRLGK